MHVSMHRADAEGLLMHAFLSLFLNLIAADATLTDCLNNCACR
jgi:hypothetical protein